MIYNSKIRWEAGMRLTADTFKQFEESLSQKQQIAIRAAIGAGRRGLLPDTPFNADGIFVRKSYEITEMKCTAVLPSGRIINVDRDMTYPIDIASSEDADYYLTLEFGPDDREFERDTVPYTDKEVILTLHTPDETDSMDVMPLKHFYVKDGSLNIDDDFIPPVLVVASDNRILQRANELKDKLTLLAFHKNMDNGDCKRALMHYAFLIRAFDEKRLLHELLTLLDEIAQALDYYIVQTHGIEIDEIPQEILKLNNDSRRQIRYSDISMYLKWLNEYIQSQNLIMDKVVIEKPVIDTEAIKKEIHDALYPELLDELSNKLLEQISAKLKEELPEAIVEELKKYLAENVQPDLRTALYGDLRNPLYNDLYEVLKKQIEDMLANVQFKQEDNFMPMI